MNLIFICLILAISPSLFWGYFFYKKDVKEPEPLKFMALAFLYGFMGAVFLMVINFVMTRYVGGKLIDYFMIKNVYTAGFFLIILLAGLEEFVKHWSVARMIEGSNIRFDQVVDGIEYSIAAALGFSFAENTYYFLDHYQALAGPGAFISLFLFRSVGTMLAHSLFSGIFGYFYGLSKKVTAICKHQNVPAHHFHKHFKEALKFHIIRRHVHGERHSVRGHEAGVLTTEGLLLAVILHVLFNVFNTLKVGEITLAYLNVPLLMGCLWYLLYLFRKQENLVNIKTVMA